MSILHSTRSRPIDSIFLEDGLVSGSNSVPSAAVFGPESAMVNEIFNNPDAWSVQFGVEGYMDSAGPTDVGEALSFDPRLYRTLTRRSSRSCVRQ